MPIANVQERREYQAKWRANRDRLRREMFIEHLGGKCVDCLSRDNLEFDHVDPKLKKFTIGNNMGKPLKTLMEEVNKCVIRCKPCHSERTKTQERPRGDTHIFSKMDKNKRDMIRKDRAGGLTTRALAEKYGIHHTNIAKMLRGFSY